MMQEMTEFWDGSGISWTVCKQSAPRSRQITTSTRHHSIFTGRMLFLTPNQQHQSTEDAKKTKNKKKKEEMEESGRIYPIFLHDMV